MECRRNCGACCIAPAISQPYWGMPEGKPAGVRCVHLTSDFLCGIFDDSRRSWACGGFQAEPWVCGENREEALQILAGLEAQTRA